MDSVLEINGLCSHRISDSFHSCMTFCHSRPGYIFGLLHLQPFHRQGNILSWKQFSSKFSEIFKVQNGNGIRRKSYFLTHLALNPHILVILDRGNMRRHLHYRLLRWSMCARHQGNFFRLIDKPCAKYSLGLSCNYSRAYAAPFIMSMKGLRVGCVYRDIWLSFHETFSVSHTVAILSCHQALIERICLTLLTATKIIA